MADPRQAELGRQIAAQATGVGRAGMGLPSGRAGRAAGRLAAAGRPGRLLPGGRRDHRPGAGDRAGTLRAARPGRDVPRVRAGPPAARRGGPAEGDGPGRARGRRGRARPGHSPGPGRRPGRDRRARSRAGSTLRSAPISPEASRTPRRRPRPRPRPQDAAADLARLAVADAARREWAEAHAGQAARAEAAERELRARGLAERIPVTDAEVAAGLGEAAGDPAIDPADWARLKAEQTARIQADREAEREKMARLTPVTDAEVDRYGGRLDPELSPEAARELAELRQALRDEHRAERAGQAEALARLIPVTDAEVERYGGERPGDGPRPDPETWAAERAAQAEQRRAEREAEAARMGRLVPVTDAEVAEASAQPRDYPALDPAEVARWRQEQAEQAAQARERERTIEPEAEAERETPHVDPDAWAAQKAAQTEQRRCRARGPCRGLGTPDPGDRRRSREVRHREREISPERAADEANLAEVRAELERIGELIDRIPDREAERQAQREEIAAEPGIRPEPEAEPSLEPSWQPGEAGGRTRPRPTPTSRWRSAKPGTQKAPAPGKSAGAFWARQGRAPRHAAAGLVTLDRRGEAAQDAGEPLVVPRQGALQVPVVLVAVDPLPLRPQRRQLPHGLGMVRPAAGEPGHVAGVVPAGELLHPPAQLGEHGPALGLADHPPRGGRRLELMRGHGLVQPLPQPLDLEAGASWSRRCPPSAASRPTGR